MIIKRDAPAYQEYAADVLANINWRLMSLAERGLWDTLRKECWVNRCVPNSPKALALLLNKPESEIAAALTPYVLAWFEEVDNYLTAPELEAYREKLMLARENMSKGGSKGGKATQIKAKKAQTLIKGFAKATLKPLSKEELHPDEACRTENQINNLTKEQQEWLADYEREPQ